jgi:hypothetical protein
MTVIGVVGLVVLVDVEEYQSGELVGDGVNDDRRVASAYMADA